MAVITCLSDLSNLRCTGLTLTQGVGLLIPAALELCIAASLLLLTHKQTRSNQWMFVVEVITHFAAVIFDFSLHENARRNRSMDASTYGTYDKALGVFTLFPIFAFTTFLLILMRKDILPLVTSRKIQKISLYAMIGFAPVIIVFHELASLDAVTYANSDDGVQIGFETASDRTMSHVMRDIELVLLIGYQTCVVISAVIYICLARSRGHGGGVIPGFVWLSIGLVINMVENIMVAAPKSFTLLILRSIMRLISRNVIFAGLVEGTDSKEGFALFPETPTFTNALPGPATRAEKSSWRSSLSHRRIYPIENVPSRRGDHRRLSSYITGSKTPHGFQPFSEDQRDQMDAEGARNRNARVTVHYADAESAPYLTLRLSGLKMPLPEVLMANVRTQELNRRDSLPQLSKASSIMTEGSSFRRPRANTIGHSGYARDTIESISMASVLPRFPALPNPTTFHPLASPTSDYPGSPARNSLPPDVITMPKPALRSLTSTSLKALPPRPQPPTSPVESFMSFHSHRSDDNQPLTSGSGSPNGTGTPRSQKRSSVLAKIQELRSKARITSSLRTPSASPTPVSASSEDSMSSRQNLSSLQISSPMRLASRRQSGYSEFSSLSPSSTARASPTTRDRDRRDSAMSAKNAQIVHARNVPVGQNKHHWSTNYAARPREPSNLGRPVIAPVAIEPVRDPDQDRSSASHHYSESQDTVSEMLRPWKREVQSIESMDQLSSLDHHSEDQHQIRKLGSVRRPRNFTVSSGESRESVALELADSEPDRKVNSVVFQNFRFPPPRQRAAEGLPLAPNQTSADRRRQLREIAALAEEGQQP